MPPTALVRSIAASVDAPMALWPVLADLFAGVHSLGSAPGTIVRLLRDAGAGRGDRVLDLACGKGAIAAAAAKTLGCRVIAVDGAAAFVEAGRELARRRGVGHLVRFLQADVRAIAGAGGAGPAAGGIRRGGFDAAIMIGLFALPDAARTLRKLTRRGGVYLVDDCFLDPKRGCAPWGLEGMPTMEECRAEIARLGDAVERVDVPTPSAVARMHGRLHARLAVNAARIGRERPRLRGALREFLRNQQAGQRLLVGAVRPAVWVVRRG